MLRRMGILNFLSLLIALTVTFTACAGTSETAKNGSIKEMASDIDETSEIPRELTPDSLPDDLDFNGMTIRISGCDVDKNVQEIDPELTGDIVDDAVYNRNRMVEGRLNIKFQATFHGDPSNHGNILRNSITSDSDDFDIVAGAQWIVLPQALEGMYRNLNDSRYIDLEQPWWWENYINELKIGKTRTFFLNGDVSLSSIYNMSCIFFNKKIIKDLGTQPEEIYALVLDGKWTYDVFAEYCRRAYMDVNGDTKRDENDIYGCMVRTSTEPDHFVYTAGNVMCTRDSDGIPSLNVMTEYFANYMQTLYDLYYNNVGVYVTPDETLMRTRFGNGGTLFLINRFISCTHLRDSKEEYGIIPFPKYGESQKEYGALVHDSSNIYCIPVTCRSFDEASATLEAMCAQNYRTVIPAFYEMALKVKYTRDNTAGIIIDLIKNSAKTDFVYAYNYALNNAGLICRTLLGSKKYDVASEWARIQKGAEKGLQDIIEMYSRLED
ncbi:MAG TPA: hypothetical protein PK778_07150 [Bacillota bacterium]|nr:hypothetical protein [Bacillota bacterium]